MGPFQGLDSVLKAAALLRGRPDIQFVLAGTGTEAVRLEAHAKESGATNVRFLRQRPVTDMPRLNALADALLVSLRDLAFFRATTPGKTQVSLACGRPLIMAVAGDAADIVERSGGGLTVPPEDPEALAQAVTQLAGLSPEERERMGSRGREYYLKEMSLEVGADRLAEIFGTMLQRRGLTPSPRPPLAT
jgi:colanic acid biosynthesis glycosyl transferase WcaI